MAMTAGRQQRLDDRQRRIIEVARERAEAGGWPAVTTRALADAIGYSQPVLYSHFPGGKSEIMNAVALTGFAELNETTRAARGELEGRAATVAVAGAYLDFASAHPAVYEAMFSLPIGATFGQADTEIELRDAFNVLAAVVSSDGADAETATEVFWSALHGLSALDRAERLRPAFRAARIDELASRFGA